MTIGYSAFGKCYASSADALDAYYSGFVIQYSASFDPATNNSSHDTLTAYKSGSTWYLQYKSVLLFGNNAIGGTFSTQIAARTDVIGSCTMDTTSTTTTTTTDTGLPADFDYTILGAVFAFAVSVVVAMYVLGRGAGVVLSIFRK